MAHSCQLATRERTASRPLLSRIERGHCERPERIYWYRFFSLDDIGAETGREITGRRNE
jgi:hypothetical protein